MHVLYCVNNILMSLPHMLTLKYLVPSSKSSADSLEEIPTGSQHQQAYPGGGMTYSSEHYT